MSFVRDLRVAAVSLFRTPGLAIAVVLTLALGIGANAAIFTLVRGVLLKPLVNRDEDRLIYIRQSAPGIRDENAAFSVPEIQDLRASVKTLSAFGDFSTMDFTMVGLGQPRSIRGGVVGGTYFDVMGLRPVLGRLIGPQDDGPNAAGVVVLTYRFWTTALHKDPSVLGKTIRLGSLGDRSATVIGVLEPCVPYPQDTEIIANLVTSPHHLSATMVTGRVHRMTELFGRLAPGATLDQARAELRSTYSAMKKDHPEAYAQEADFQIGVKLLRDQITSGARTVLLVLLAASGLVFIIACSNVANLILARTVRREGELAIRVALGASKGALRRMLLAESLLLCGAGAALGVMSAKPMVAILARYASRFSVRALDLRVDSSLLWVGATLAIVAAVILAFVPRLPSSGTPSGLSLSSGSVRIAGSTSRRQRIFVVIQIAASFVLLAGASTLVTTLIALQRAQTGLDTQHVLAIDVPAMSYGRTPQQVVDFYKEAIRRIDALPGVSGTAFGDVVPWRDAGGPGGLGLQFSADGHVHVAGSEDPRAQPRAVSPGFFAALGVPIIAGRDFNALDNQSTNQEPVVIVSETLAQRMFPNQDAVNRHVYWTDPVLQFFPGSDLEKSRLMAPHRIIGVTADIDDDHVVPEPTLSIYSPFDEGLIFGGRLFIHTGANPYALVPSVTRVIRDMSADQPVEHAATLEDIRAEVLTPDRLNSLVFGVFAAVALAIAVVGVAGVLAFSVSARTREFGIRLALGSGPQRLLKGVIVEGTVMAAAGVLAGAAFGFVLARLAGRYFLDIKMPGALPVFVSAFVLMAVAVIASVLPAARAARVDVMQALRSE
ncbi:ADOP family duplicated permease [Tunturibacter empetritectus]|uniref:Permease n=1 Tax=Tunturiibacter lichenicola TaxID=2051959 RepID=A0A7W8JAU9_9BACT|nr:ADOP family duplicated permease [Edaphobacter lichenicola]MBB5345878.1 putative permease [Edaphobacter lichenicola]